MVGGGRKKRLSPTAAADTLAAVAAASSRGKSIAGEMRFVLALCDPVKRLESAYIFFRGRRGGPFTRLAYYE